MAKSPLYIAFLAGLAAVSLYPVAQTRMARLPAVVHTQMQTAPVLRILSPQMGQQIRQTAINVHYDLEARQGVPTTPSPTFEVKLDTRDAVRTEELSSSFTGLVPGRHVVMVQVVDANGLAIPGTRSEVQFTVLPPAAGLPGTGVGSSPHPQGASTLPLLSLIGAGALAGGLMSARRTRRSRSS